MLHYVTSVVEKTKQYMKPEQYTFCKRRIIGAEILRTDVSISVKSVELRPLTCLKMSVGSGIHLK